MRKSSQVTFKIDRSNAECSAMFISMIIISIYMALLPYISTYLFSKLFSDVPVSNMWSVNLLVFTTVIPLFWLSVLLIKTWIINFFKNLSWWNYEIWNYEYSSTNKEIWWSFWLLFSIIMVIISWITLVYLNSKLSEIESNNSLTVNWNFVSSDWDGEFDVKVEKSNNIKIDEWKLICLHETLNKSELKFENWILKLTSIWCKDTYSQKDRSNKNVFIQSLEWKISYDIYKLLKDNNLKEIKVLTKDMKTWNEFEAFISLK